MNAFNNVNLAAAVILTSTAYATEIGIPKSQWVYPLGGAGTRDSEKCMLPSHVQQVQLTIYSLGASKLLLQPVYYEVSRRRVGSMRLDEGPNRSL